MARFESERSILATYKYRMLNSISLITSSISQQATISISLNFLVSTTFQIVSQVRTDRFSVSAARGSYESTLIHRELSNWTVLEPQ